jgi:hypothetical protein
MRRNLLVVFYFPSHLAIADCLSAFNATTLSSDVQPSDLNCKYLFKYYTNATGASCDITDKALVNLINCLIDPVAQAYTGEHTKPLLDTSSLSLMQLCHYCAHRLCTHIVYRGAQTPL